MFNTFKLRVKYTTFTLTEFLSTLDNFGASYENHAHRDSATYL